MRPTARTNQEAQAQLALDVLHARAISLRAELAGLRGAGANTQGIGARINVRSGSFVQMQEMICGGRFILQSSHRLS